MPKENKPSYLVEISYKHSLNKFYEFYGDGVSYASIEQESYIDFKNMVFEKIGKNIKFRKFGREGKVLTIKVDMSQKDYAKMLKLNEQGGLKFMYEYEISNIKLFNKEN